MPFDPCLIYAYPALSEKTYGALPEVTGLCPLFKFAPFLIFSLLLLPSNLLGKELAD